MTDCTCASQELLQLFLFCKSEREERKGKEGLPPIYSGILTPSNPRAEPSLQRKEDELRLASASAGSIAATS